MGACADLMVQPYGAFAAGCVAGCVSTFGYQIIQVNFQIDIKDNFLSLIKIKTCFLTFLALTLLLKIHK